MRPRWGQVRGRVALLAAIWGYRVTQTGYLNKAVAEGTRGVPCLEGTRLQTGKVTPRVDPASVWEDYSGYSAWLFPAGTICGNMMT